MLTSDEIEAAFSEHSEAEFLEFGRIESPTTKRRDLMAFNLLDSLHPGDRDIVAAAEHDEIRLDFSAEDLAGKITLEQVVTLLRCGVWCDGGSLCMFA